jgi:ribosomal protein S18 acetylase RimI-like enzyme
MMNPCRARTALVAEFRAIREAPHPARELARAAIRSRNDPESESAPFLSAIEQDIANGAAQGVLRLRDGRPIGIALWAPPQSAGLTIEVLHLVPELQTPEEYREFFAEIGDRVGPIAFAPGRLAGLSGPTEDRVMQGLGFARFSRSEMRLPPEAPDPTAPFVPGLRASTGADEPELARLHDAAYRDHLDRFLFQLDPEPRRDAELQIREILRGRWGDWLCWASFVVPESGALAAATLVVRAPYGPLIADVMVDPRCQGRGLGRAVLSASVRALRAHAESPIVLNVTEGNLRAIRLYERAGFVRTLGPSHGWYSPARIPVRALDA